MRRLVLLVLLSAVGFVANARNRDQMIVMFWNLENFFDWTDQGTGESDSEFSSKGKKHWTKDKFYIKCDAVSKAIFMAGESYGRIPDVIGFAEVENKGVLQRLLSSTLLRKCDYKVVHFDSGDRRGIDVALLYREGLFELISTSVKVPGYDGARMQTRDMLYVCLKSKSSGEEYDFIVCHHPSKFGGEKISGPKRDAAMEALVHMCDSIGGERQIVMGDFNDSPSAPQFDLLEGRLINKSEGLFMAHKGTIKYDGKWELIDMFLVSPDLDSCTEMMIAEFPFLMVKDSRHAGIKPLRTYSGPRYIGGVSDHLPIVLNLGNVLSK